MSRPSLSVVVPVYRRAEQACAALAALFDQSLPDEVAMEIIVVDDGSGDGTAAHIDAMFGTRIRLLRMPTNRGRAEARSRGIADARSERIVLLDCDCVPAHRHYLSTLWACFEGGAAIVAGPISGYGGTFWDRYQRLGSTRRAKQIRAGIPGVGSSANLAFDKQTYLAAGGFDPRYRHYGFEDRDLLLRLGLHGRLMWADEAEVRHMDALSMREICNKMREAGRHSAGLFASEHPEAYVQSGYAALDTRVHHWLRWVTMATSPAVPWLSRIVDRLIGWSILPFRLRAVMVKAVTGLGFMQGTWQAQRDAAP